MIEESSILLQNIASIGITWVDGRVIFKNHELKWAKMYLGICHFQPSIWCITPRDYDRITFVTTIKVDPIAIYCERSHTCLDFKCELNRFNKEEYIKLFDGCGEFTLGMPSDFSTKDIWFNDPNLKWRYMWGKYALRPEGGTLRYDESKG